MASFVTDLWESIFVPGPTPSILIATNVTFAALQLVLVLLLFATYSVHFLVLSILCGGLWWSINWFAAELAAVQLEEEKKKKKKNAGLDATDPSADSATPGPADDSDTEVETSSVGRRKVKRSAAATAAASVEPIEPVGELKQRVESQSSVSTEDEWEKVSESEPEKTK
ncbi:ER protein Pkr1-domain-containing protein [Stachybotrys elegans]|uniref:ER protein Pkr1-domain-containing protein n=1 Tax=Stachybotrys elegans TaxID=80388 RepID=A0A8K0T7R8_9HYPO|nr:ER protein Pkr1-domain-containing protein [Stachybotrys elegans]